MLAESVFVFPRYGNSLRVTMHLWSITKNFALTLPIRIDVKFLRDLRTVKRPEPHSSSGSSTLKASSEQRIRDKDQYMMKNVNNKMNT